ncbi:DUF6879 family protein [Streptomyces hoynatensis]|uniref:DUF6879 domain-containing protein n=1 Tax=Streptomyces hoynatensis TaxID=1141874 RepID=A0A3A9YUK4_9ACTN|nr:DUF6879 family protein [Streptomyces hoynatensis]RKN39732.1 hypothetical protein D7294_20020 [Streptomyces hoynatensis]
MSQSSVPSFDKLLASCRRSAVHLEMRDSYGVSYEAEDLAAWRRTGRWDNPDYWEPWMTLVRDAVSRGVAMRRARIVSEPVTEYIRFEYAGTSNNVAAGEDVRWLPRRRASDLALPGNDFWLFDDRLVEWNHFTGDGELAGHELSDDPAVVKLCGHAFEAVWERAVPHGEFHV